MLACQIEDASDEFKHTDHSADRSKLVAEIGSQLISDADGLLNRLGSIEHTKHKMSDVGA